MSIAWLGVSGCGSNTKVTLNTTRTEHQVISDVTLNTTRTEHQVISDAHLRITISSQSAANVDPMFESGSEFEF